MPRERMETSDQESARGVIWPVGNRPVGYIRFEIPPPPRPHVGSSPTPARIFLIATLYLFHSSHCHQNVTENIRRDRNGQKRPQRIELYLVWGGVQAERWRKIGGGVQRTEKDDSDQVNRGITSLLKTEELPFRGRRAGSILATTACGIKS